MYFSDELQVTYDWVVWGRSNSDDTSVTHSLVSKPLGCELHRGPKCHSWLQPRGQLTGNDSRANGLKNGQENILEQSREACLPCVKSESVDSIVRVPLEQRGMTFERTLRGLTRV